MSRSRRGVYHLRGVEDKDGESRKKSCSTDKEKKADVEDGSAWGWVVVGSIFSINLLNFGHFRSFGLYIQPMITTFQASPSQVAWVISIQHGLFSFLAPAASTLAEIWSPRIVAVTGGLLASIGFAAASQVTKIYYLYCTFSLFGGLAVAFTHIPSLTMIAAHFQKRRGLANGLCMSGNALGGIIFPLFIEQLLEEFGLRGTLLIAGGLLGNICVCAMFWRPIAKSQTAAPKVENEKQQTDGQVNPTFELETLPENKVLDGNSDKHHNGNNSTNNHHELSESVITLQQNNCNENSILPNSKPLKQQKGSYRLLDLSAFANVSFWLYAACKTFIMAGYPGIRLFVPLWAVHVGCTQKDVAVVFSVMAVADFFGRVLIAGLSDMCVGEGRSRMFAASIALAGVTTFGYPYCHNATLLAIVSGIFGFWVGASIGLTSSVICDIFGGNKVAKISGMISIFSGIGGLLGPPMLGLLVEKTNNLLHCQQVSSAIIVFSAFIWLSKSICIRNKLRSEN